MTGHIRDTHTSTFISSVSGTKPLVGQMNTYDTITSYPRDLTSTDTTSGTTRRIPKIKWVDVLPLLLPWMESYSTNVSNFTCILMNHITYSSIDDDNNYNKKEKQQ